MEAGDGALRRAGAGNPSQMLCCASLVAGGYSGCVSGRGRNPLPPQHQGVGAMVKLELDPSLLVQRYPIAPCARFGFQGRSVPEPIGDFAGDHGAGLHHHIVAGGVDMTEKARPGAMGRPVGIAAVFAGIEPEGAHVLGPMRFRFHDDGDAVAGFLPGKRALRWRIAAVIWAEFIDRRQYEPPPLAFSTKAAGSSGSGGR